MALFRVGRKNYEGGTDQNQTLGLKTPFFPVKNRGFGTLVIFLRKCSKLQKGPLTMENSEKFQFFGKVHPSTFFRQFEGVFLQTLFLLSP